MTSFPCEWKIESLDSLINRGVIKLNRGDIISKRDIAAHPGDYPIFSSAKENNGMFGRYGKYMFDEEVITWSIDGGGRLFYREKQKFSVTNVGGILRIIDKNVFDYKFLFYALTNLHSQVIFDWSRKAHPSVIRLVYDKVPIPPLDEQHKIVELLEEHLLHLDAALVEVNQAKIKATQFRKSLLQAAFTGQLSNNGADIIKIPFDETFDVRSTNGKAVKQKDYLPEGKYPVIDQGEQFISGYSNEESLVLDFKQPVIIFGDHTRRIKYADFPFVPGADGTKILSQSNNLHSRFAYYQLESKELRNRGYARHFSELRKEEFWVPSIDVQLHVVEILEAHLSHLDESIRLAYLMEKQSAGLRRSLLQAAFTGQLTKGVENV
jgi:restriction endonuclease S subunit